MITTAKRKKKDESIIIHQLNIRQVNRSSQDIESWRTAIRAAESIFSYNRTLLYDLFHDLLLDGHLWSVIDKRITAVTNSTITFTDNGEEIEAITDLIETEEFTDMVAELLWSKFWGHTLYELPFNKDSFTGQLINRKHVVPEKGIIKKNQSDLTGFDFRVPPYTNHTIEAGKKNDLGLLMKAAQYVIYKRGGFGDWAQFAELFGMPFRKGLYDGHDPKTRDLLTQSLDQMGSAPYVVIPREADVEIVPNNSQGSKDTYSGLIEACNKEISKLIVGQTMTSEDGSSHSQSQTHMEVQAEIHFADRLFITRLLNHRLRPLLAKHGYEIGKGSFQFVVEEKIPKDKLIKIHRDVAKEVPVGDDFWYDTYGVPKPDNYDELKAEQKAQKEVAQKLLNQPKKDDNKKIKNWFKGFFH